MDYNVGDRRVKLNKEGNVWVATFEDAAPVVKYNEPTIKDPNIKVDIGRDFKPSRVKYPENYTEEQIVKGLTRITEEGCKTCEREKERRGGRPIVGPFRRRLRERLNNR